MSLRQCQRLRALFTVSFLAITFVAMPHTANAGTDEMWEVTTKTEMAGMPMAMPAMTNQTCLPKDRKSDDALVPKDKNSDCKMDSLQTSGNKTTFKMTCTGKNAMSGSGEIEKSADTYRGSMHIVGNAEGRPIDMTQNFSGKKIGSCTYEDVGKKIVAQQQAYNAEMCRKGIDELQPLVFSDAKQFEACKPFKKEFCARVTKVSAEMRDPDGFRNLVKKQSDWKTLLTTCGIEPQTVLDDSCKKGKAAQDWNFIVDYCPADAKALATEYCAGRDYTSAMTGPYAPLCRSYGRSQLQVQQDQPAAPSKEEALKNGVSEGVNKLKKLLPF
ncbi:MAG: hypothetical protein JWM78_207 [Verrucomicrobiaceae bacterium]|nr:hypothetical protein [Verrucomicrobiaceae bacterium]